MTTVVLWVSDLEASVRFYQALFNAKTPYITDGFASVVGAGNEVLLHVVPEQYRGQAAIGADNPIKPVFEVADIDGLYQGVAAVGGSLQSASQTHGNWRYVDGTDPDGHVIQVRQRA